MMKHFLFLLLIIPCLTLNTVQGHTMVKEKKKNVTVDKKEKKKKEKKVEEKKEDKKEKKKEEKEPKAPKVKTPTLTKHRVEKAWDFSFGGGVTTFYKETMGVNDYAKMAPLGTFGIHRSINDIMIIGLDANYATVLGQPAQPMMIDGKLNFILNFSNWANKDVVDSKFTFYGKIGGGVNYLEPTSELPSPLQNMVYSVGAGLIVDYNFSKHFALRLTADGNVLSKQYYEGTSDKDYNLNRNPVYLNASLGLAYKFNFRRNKEEKMEKLVRSQNKQFFRKEVHEFDVKTKEYIGKGDECFVDVDVIKGKFQADAKLELELLPGIMGYNEKTGKYDLETIKIIDDNMTAKDTIHYQFKLKASQDFDRGIYVLGTYSYINKNKRRPKVKINSSVYKGAKWEFRVQLAAFSNIPFTNDIAKKFFRVDAEIIDEGANGITKFLIGHFTSYAEAKEYCRKIQEDTTISDAFVVGYKDGVRVRSLKGEHFGSYK